MVSLSTKAVPADAFKLPCSEALCIYKNGGSYRNNGAFVVK